MQVECQKCSKDLGYGFDEARHRVTLLGNYQAILCNSCSNLWTEHSIDVNKVAHEADDVNLSKQCALTVTYEGTGSDKTDELSTKLKPLIQEHRENSNELFFVAKKWIEDKIPVPSVAATP